MADTKNSYLTLMGEGRAESLIKGSRFIAVSRCVDSREAFNAFLDKEIDRFPDATHHCWAFRIGGDQLEELSGDDGEPSGSAGLPILRVLAGAGVIDAACIVSRYFGGTKLGVGGLMRAYSQTASLAVRDSGIEERVVTYTFFIQLPYSVHDEFTANVNRLRGEIIESDFGVDVKLKIRIPRNTVPEIEDIVASLTHGKAKIEGA